MATGNDRKSGEIESVLEASLPFPTDRNDASVEVIERINAMIKSGALMPGDRLPSEIKFASQLGISRSAVTKAYAKLEAFGLIRTVPQSGTYIAGIGGDALTALLSNVMDTDLIKIEDEDIDTLYQFRAHVEEIVAVSLAETAGEEEIAKLRERQAQVKHRIFHENGTIENDMLFHIEMADLSGRPFFKALLLFITLPMVQVFRRFERDTHSASVRQRWQRAMSEHDEIVEAIAAHDIPRVRAAIRDHFKNAVVFRANLIKTEDARSEATKSQ